MTFQEILVFLKNQSKLYVNNIDNLNETLEKILNRLDVEELINSILHDDDYLRIVASASYSHGLGFDKIIIIPYRADNTYQLRFNIWWDSILIEDNHYEDIHNHRWNFSTVVLTGAYKYENYRVRKSGKEMFHYHYFPIKNGKYVFEYQGKRRIDLFASGTLNKGEFMSVSSDVLHRVLPLKKSLPTVTLFLTSKPKTSKTSIYSENLIDGTYVNKPAIKPNELKLKLIELLKLL